MQKSLNWQISDTILKTGWIPSVNPNENIASDRNIGGITELILKTNYKLKAIHIQGPAFQHTVDKRSIAEIPGWLIYYNLFMIS